jgi:hypothetical protein
MLRPTVSRPVCIGIKYLSGAGLLMLGALPDERTGLSVAIAAGPCQRRVPWDSRPNFTVLDSRLYFSLSAFYIPYYLYSLEADP